MGTTIAMDHGYLDYKGFAADVYGTPGQEKFDPILEFLAEEARLVAGIKKACLAALGLAAGGCGKTPEIATDGTELQAAVEVLEGEGGASLVQLADAHVEGDVGCRRAGQLEVLAGVRPLLEPDVAERHLQV